MYVVGLLLLGVEGGGKEADAGLLGKYTTQPYRAEQRAEDILLLTVEVDLERLHVLHSAKRRLTVRRTEVIVVFRNITYQVQRPALVGLVGDIGLVVQEVRTVFAFGFQRTKQIAVGLVAQTVTHREFLVAVAHKKAST